METNKTLVLTFSDGAGNKKTLTINKPAEGLEAAVISAQMDVIIGANLVTVKETGEVVTQKVSAKFVTQTKTSVSVTA